ncbi:MAG TPA: DUF222 domain-containing protein, partial [Streptosporangiaceae bacterium]|nr:DUF222 domain-containing protein [Streptosporangiaceae bacterium]
MQQADGLVEPPRITHTSIICSTTDNPNRPKQICGKVPDVETRQRDPDRPPPTIDHVALAAGVSRSTAARVLSGHGSASDTSAATFLIHAGRTARATAHHDARAAAMIAPDGLLPQLGAAFAAGEISRAHVDVAVRAIRQLPKRLLRRVDADGRTVAEQADAFLVEYCRRFPPDDVRVLLRHLLAIVDPDGQDRFDGE